MPEYRNGDTASWDTEQVRRSQSGGQQKRPSKKKRRKTPWILKFIGYILFVAITSCILAGVGWMLMNDLCAFNKADITATIEVTADDDMETISTKLQEAGLVEYKWFFQLFGKVAKAEEKIGIGTYELNTDMDYRALLAGMSLSSATRAEVQVTIPEGYTVAQIFQLLEEKGVATVEDLNEQAANHDYAFSFLQDIPLGDPNRLEGYLYPDTYTFYTPHSALYAINKMLVNFDARFTDAMREEVLAGGKTIHEIVTIASLIEKETDGTDHKKIASVIYNRLNSNGETAGFLQIDATLAYLNGGKVPTDADKQIDSPYNTYKYKGLPPAPICNPGMDSIQAAMHPDSTGYFYYALGDDGVHHFNKTYNDHLNFINSQQMYKK